MDLGKRLFPIFALALDLCVVHFRQDICLLHTTELSTTLTSTLRTRGP